MSDDILINISDKLSIIIIQLEQLLNKEEKEEPTYETYTPSGNTLNGFCEKCNRRYGDLYYACCGFTDCPLATTTTKLSSSNE